MSIEQLKVELRTAIQQAEHKPGDWSQTAQSMGGICCPGEKFQFGKPWPKEAPWAQFSYKRDSWLAVAAVNALPGLLKEIERLIGFEDAYATACNVRNRLIEENETLRKYAERYRWLRDKQTFIWLIQDWFPVEEFTDVDAEIEAAMAKERGQ
ncbi:hypothetical protein ACX3X6_08830 [Pseudomonas sichuanensis]